MSIIRACANDSSSVKADDRVGTTRSPIVGPDAVPDGTSSQDTYLALPRLNCYRARQCAGGDN